MWTQVIYEYASSAANNGSVFEGLGNSQPAPLSPMKVLIPSVPHQLRFFGIGFLCCSSTPYVWGLSQKLRTLLLWDKPLDFLVEHWRTSLIEGFEVVSDHYCFFSCFKSSANSSLASASDISSISSRISWKTSSSFCAKSNYNSLLIFSRCVAFEPMEEKHRLV